MVALLLGTTASHAEEALDVPEPPGIPDVEAACGGRLRGAAARTPEARALRRTVGDLTAAMHDVVGSFQRLTATRRCLRDGRCRAEAGRTGRALDAAAASYTVMLASSVRDHAIEVGARCQALGPRSSAADVQAVVDRADRALDAANTAYTERVAQRIALEDTFRRSLSCDLFGSP